MFKYTRHTLKKIEAILEELGYTIRYEKGSFQSGYCLVENRKIAIINKFFETEGRINTLLDILADLEVDESRLSEPSQKIFRKITKTLNQQGADEEE